MHGTSVVHALLGPMSVCLAGSILFLYCNPFGSRPLRCLIPLDWIITDIDGSAARIAMPCT